MDRQRIDHLTTSLRLLSHDGLGATGISASERADLRAAARTLDHLHGIAAELAAALGGVLDYGSIAHGDAFTALSHWHFPDGQQPAADTAQEAGR
jgi:hypothetical protein